MGLVPEAEAEQALFKEALQNPALVGRMMHNNFMYQDPNEGPSILNVNASILEAEIEYRRQYLAKRTVRNTTSLPPSITKKRRGPISKSSIQRAMGPDAASQAHSRCLTTRTGAHRGGRTGIQGDILCGRTICGASWPKIVPRSKGDTTGN